jgi:hypothetical protein
MAAQRASDSLLARTDAYVKKRDGVDKLLKLMRYTAALAALGGQSAGGRREGGQGLLGVELVARLSRLESTLGVARKALRMGKFLGNAVSLRDACTTIASGTARRSSTVLACCMSCAASVLVHAEQMKAVVVGGSQGHRTR